eukprot:jgi/Chrzof1/7840/Cz02g38140.t1
MEPGFQRGDILFLNMGKAPIRTGEIVVFNIDGRDIPIVHRVIKVHERANEDHVDILTKVRAAGAPNRCSDGTQVCKHALWLEMLHCSLMLSDVGAACCCMLQGDNNYGDDRLLYARGQDWLHKHHIMGRAVGFLPYVGMVTIIMNDYPMLKYALIAALAILVLTSKD